MKEESQKCNSPKNKLIFFLIISTFIIMFGVFTFTWLIMFINLFK